MIIISTDSTPHLFRTPKTANGVIQDSISNTYYTVLEITGKGVLKRISLFPGHNSYYNDDLKVRLTIDGFQQEHQYPYSYLITRGIGGSDGMGRANFFDILTEIMFNNSLKVEIAQTSGLNGLELDYTIDYHLI